MKTRIKFSYDKIQIGFSHPESRHSELIISVLDPGTENQNYRASWWGGSSKVTAEGFRVGSRIQASAAESLDVLNLCGGIALHSDNTGLQLEYDDESKEMSITPACIFRHGICTVAFEGFENQLRLMGMVVHCSTDELYQAFTAKAWETIKQSLAAEDFNAVICKSSGNATANLL